MAGPEPDPPPGPLDLLPNLRPVPATDLMLEVSREGRRLLRLTTEVGNTGRGPLELRPAVTDCDGNGDPRDDRLAYQRIYQDANRNGIFESRVDRDHRDRFAGCMRFHPAHDHWHFAGFASYALVNRRNGRTVASTSKVSFCAIDTDPRWPRLPGFRNRGRYVDCAASKPQGVSVGWGDIYGSGLPGQVLDLTAVGRGHYCLVTIADPDRRMLELDETDNAAGTSVTLLGGRQVRRGKRPCFASAARR